MRGRVLDVTFFMICSRITPAYAGKSYTVLRLLGWLRDHPRVCGEETKKIP